MSRTQPPMQPPVQPSGQAAIQHHMDAQGLFCPEPVMMLHSKMDEMSAGECVEILATDPSTRRDFIKFCSFLSHQLLVDEERDGVFRYVIRKAN